MIIQHILFSAYGFGFYITDKSVLAAYLTPGAGSIQYSHQIAFLHFCQDRTLHAALLPDLSLFLNALVCHIIPMIRDHNTIRILIGFIMDIRIFLYKAHGQIHLTVPYQSDHVICCLHRLSQQIGRCIRCHIDKSFRRNITQHLLCRIPVKPFVQIFVYNPVIHIHFIILQDCFLLHLFIVENDKHFVLLLQFVILAVICNFLGSRIFFQKSGQSDDRDHHNDQQRHCHHQNCFLSFPIVRLSLRSHCFLLFFCIYYQISSEKVSEYVCLLQSLCNQYT